MATPRDQAEHFLALHQGPDVLLLPNPWDVGSARLLAALGYRALATTSSGFATSLGRTDGSVTREEALAHAATIVAATDLPVSADLENGFADDSAAVARTVELAGDAGLAGCSIEDFCPGAVAADPMYPLAVAAERIAAAAEAAHAHPAHLVLTARADGHVHGQSDLGETIVRLQAYQEAGADVLYAPGLAEMADVRRVVESVDRPVNVLARPGLASVAELAAAGVRRVSVGGAFAFAAVHALVDAAEELRDRGTFGFLAHAGAGRTAAGRALA